MAAANYSSYKCVYGKVVLDKFVKTNRDPEFVSKLDGAKLI